MTATPASPYVDLMTERLAAKGAETVLRYQRCDISAAELRASIHRYARALAGLGIGRGDLVALFATNSPDAIAIRYASHLAGAAAAVYLDATLAEDGEAGSIEVRSPAMAAGFRNRPVEQAAAFRDGWYRTGDLGLLDDEGYLHILGRAADITWTDGVMISPALIQYTLCRVPGVRYAVVVTDPEAAARVSAVVPWPGSAVDTDACRAAVATEYGSEAAASLALVLLARVPRTEQGKPDRPAIRTLGGEAGVSLQARMREIVTRMAEAENTSLHDAYYDPDFLLTVNGQSQGLAAFRAEHDRVQRTGITFAVTYDEDSWVEAQDSLAGRTWITTHSACGRAARIEVLFVAAYRSGRLLRLTALTRPDPILPGALDS